jgi:hypothetical protein
LSQLVVKPLNLANHLLDGKMRLNMRLAGRAEARC